jgi:lipoyl(octanoyl) transferase
LLSSCEAPFTWWGIVEYKAALAKMETAQAEAIAARSNQDVRPADSFFYLEHPPVITYGRSTPPEELTLGAPGIPRVSVPRGGLATYHAPGQLVGYIVMDLSRRKGTAPDIHAYLRAIERGLIDFLHEEFGLQTTRRDGFTGVWTPPPTDGSHPGRKLASIGVSARKWVTSHGFALNICPDMSGFSAIVPCGITDAEMTSVELELAREERQLKLKPLGEWAQRAHECLVNALQAEGWFPDAFLLHKSQHTL